MAKSKELRKGPEWKKSEQKARIERRRDERRLVESLSGTPFDMMSADEKDQLLRLIAIKLGLIEG